MRQSPFPYLPSSSASPRPSRPLATFSRSPLSLLLLLLSPLPTLGSQSIQSSQSRADATFARAAIAGGAAAAAATVTFHPIDTVKTVLQRRGGGLSAVRGLGLRGLYTGVVPAAFSMMPACAVRMGAYEVFKAALLLRVGSLSPGASVALASALSVVVSASVRAPLDMVKTQVRRTRGRRGSVGNGRWRGRRWWGGRWSGKGHERKGLGRWKGSGEEKMRGRPH